MFQVTVDGDPKIRFLMSALQRVLTHVVCMVTISRPKVHDCTLVKVEGLLPVSLYWIVRSRSFWMISQSSVVRVFPPIFVSSADLEMKDISPISKSLMNIVKRTVPCTDPWGTLLVTASHWESCLLSKTRCFLPWSQSVIHVGRLSPLPGDFSFQGVVCVVRTLSKDLWKSRHIILQGICWSQFL